MRTGARPTEVTITLSIEREGWHSSPYGELFGAFEKTAELRAEVSYEHGQPVVEWCDQEVVDALELLESELEGAEELAAEAAYLKLRAAAELLGVLQEAG